MTIARVIANLYICFKFKHQWTRLNGNSNGNGDQRAESATMVIGQTEDEVMKRGVEHLVKDHE
jgi:hypothetical protein